MELYRAMMNHGFIIFESDTKFVIHKTLTPANQLSMSGGQNWQFNSFDDALAEVKRLIGWKDSTTATMQTTSTSWKMQMMYRHKGMGTKFVDLGELGSTSYETAVAEAKNRAESYIIKSDMEKEVIGFEVKVRPCN